MKKSFCEQGVLITPCSEQTNQYVACLLKTCRKYNIDYPTATERERNFVLECVNEQLNHREAM